MKNYTVEVLQDEPIIIVTVTPEYSISRDMPLSRVESKALLDAAGDKRYFYILDISKLSISLEEMISASNLGARGKAPDVVVEDDTPLWHHPNIIQNIIITKSGILKLAAKGLGTTAFGNLNVHVEENRDEALSYCRTHLAE